MLLLLQSEGRTAKNAQSQVTAFFSSSEPPPKSRRKYCCLQRSGPNFSMFPSSHRNLYLHKYVCVYMAKERINISIDIDIARQMRDASLKKYGNLKSFSTLIEDMFKGLDSKPNINVEDIKASHERYIEEYAMEAVTAGKTCGLPFTRQLICNVCGSEFSTQPINAKFCPACTSPKVRIMKFEEETLHSKMVDKLSQLYDTKINEMLDKGMKPTHIAKELNIKTSDVKSIIAKNNATKIKEMWDKGVQDAEVIAIELNLKRENVELSIEDIKWNIEHPDGKFEIPNFSDIVPPSKE